MSVIQMKQLLEAGVHYGTNTNRWNPKMKKYIFGARQKLHIIDLDQTVKGIDAAYDFLKSLSAENKTVLFVGSKRQAKEAIKNAALRCGMYYMNERWLGGTLTNFDTIRSRVDRLNKLNQDEQIGTWDMFTKKEVKELRDERDKLQTNLGGIVAMRQLPDAIFVVDLINEHLAIAEARKLHIPIVGIVDTNCDPDLVDYVIPGNDDAIKAITLISNTMADAIIAGKEGEAAIDPDANVASEKGEEAPIEEAKEVVENKDNKND